MGFAGSKAFLIIIYVLILLTLIIQTLGLALNYWWTVGSVDVSPTDQASVFGGLWMMCLDADSFGNLNCYGYTSLDKQDGWFIAVRALAIAGTAILFLAFISCFIATVSRGKAAKLVTALLCFLAFLVIGAEWAVYVRYVEVEGWVAVDQMKNENIPAEEFLATLSPSYSGSFGITIVADFLCLVSGILGLISWRANEKELVWPV